MTKQQAPSDSYKPDWLASLDKRTTVANDLRQRHKDLCDDLGGIESLSYQKRSLVDRIIFLEFHLQDEERKLANGEDFNCGSWIQGANSLSGILAKIGIEKQQSKGLPPPIIINIVDPNVS
jgi:hypothetical protein